MLIKIVLILMAPLHSRNGTDTRLFGRLLGHERVRNRVECFPELAVHEELANLPPVLHTLHMLHQGVRSVHPVDQ